MTEILIVLLQVFQITLFVIVVFFILRALSIQLFGDGFRRIYYWFMR